MLSEAVSLDVIPADGTRRGQIRRNLAPSGSENPLFNCVKIKDVFFESDLFYFKGLTNHIINKYFDEKTFISENNFFYKLSPTKAEYLVWKNTFKHKKIKHILSIPYYFIKRVFFLNSFFVKKPFLPYSIGSKKNDITNNF